MASLIQNPLFGNSKSQHLSVPTLVVPAMPQNHTADSSEVGSNQTGSVLQCAIDPAFTCNSFMLPQPDIHKAFPVKRS